MRGGPARTRAEQGGARDPGHRPVRDGARPGQSRTSPSASWWPDFDTEVTTIPGRHHLYSLVMVALMRDHRRQALATDGAASVPFRIGLVIYACGPAPTTGVLVGRRPRPRLVRPRGHRCRPGHAGAGGPRRRELPGQGPGRCLRGAGRVAAPASPSAPSSGGWVTTNLTWRLVFVGEVVLVRSSSSCCAAMDDAPRMGVPPARLVGSVLSGPGLTLVVLGALQSGTWAGSSPCNAPVEPFGPHPVRDRRRRALPHAFTCWQRHRERDRRDPLVRLGPPPASRRCGRAWSCSSAQNTILLGLFFIMPLYLQIVQGYDAFGRACGCSPSR